MKEGHMPEEMYDNLGFPPDYDEGEYGVDCHGGIEQEHIQRPKPLMHNVQIFLCTSYKDKKKRKEKERLERNKEKENEKKRKKKIAVNAIIKTNNKIDEVNKVYELKNVVYSRKFCDLNDDFSFPLKGSLNKAEKIMSTVDMDDNLLSLAFKNWNQSVIFKAEKVSLEKSEIDDNTCDDIVSMEGNEVMDTEFDTECIVTKDSRDDKCDYDGSNGVHESLILDDGQDLNEYYSYHDIVGTLNV
eukprot:13486041-Ditylum_brightwellii.AAC.1